MFDIRYKSVLDTTSTMCSSSLSNVLYVNYIQSNIGETCILYQ